MASTSTSGNKIQIEEMGAFDEIAPAASTSASKVMKSYDVFINHRGPDVKSTLATVLYAMLTGVALSVFLDAPELVYGDFLPRTIEAAMTSAFLHIAIFSERYAESPWCLAELSFMLKIGAKIIPVFYHVEPCNLRQVAEGKGMYAKAFEEHKQKGRYSPEKLQEWKDALFNVSFYSGEIIRNKEDEMRLLKNIVNIVNIVLKEKKNNVSLVVAKHPVGLKEMVQDFEMNFLKSAQCDQHVQIVGIWGMGGSGKTTLAKELYNQKSSQMERSSIVFNVRDAATKGLLHEKQKKLLTDLGVRDVPFDNIEEGMSILSNHLRALKILIVLDDVDNRNQLDALLPTKDNLKSGSLIIVTTRARDVLKSWGISSIYKMKPLDPLHAEQLFCWHAFVKLCPLDGFNELVKKFVGACNGLPLSLMIFGAELYGEFRKGYWESQLHKILRILPDNIHETLKISYDSLDPEEKETCLDVACFFIGEQISLAIEVWNGLGYSSLRNWERLLHRCLVEIDDSNRIRMHDHIRDMGRDIANKQSPYRLWFLQQIINTEKEKKKRIGIRGITATSNQLEQFINSGAGEFYSIISKIEDDESHIYCSDEQLMVNTNRGIWSLSPSLVGLKYLVISGDSFNQIMGQVSRELVWLRWFQIGRRNLPSELSFKKLSVLELCETREQCQLEELWETDEEAPVRLRELFLCGCHKFQGFPKSIGLLNHLKKIVIIHCRNVTSLPDEFCLLQSLEHLSLPGINVTSLPDEFCLLQSLEHLSLPGSKIVALPSNIGNLSNLRHLNLFNCWTLRSLPVSFKNLMLLEHLDLGDCSQLSFRSEDLNFLENITKLEYLNLEGCEQLEELPRHILNQASLRELSFSVTSLRELPDNIGQLRRLTSMTISYVLLTSLPSSLADLSSLTKLYIHDCRNLERLGVESLPKSIRQMSNLQVLDISQCPISELDFGAASLTFGSSNLKEITLMETEVCRISFAEHCCPHLKSLHVSHNHHLEEIEALPSTLESIHLENCEMLKNIPSFAQSTSLKEFVVSGCYGIEKIEGIENCEGLTELRIATCWEVLGIESLERVQSLKELELRANKGSVIERCIERIQKWPDEITICTRAVPDAASLVHSLLSPNLVIVDSISNHKIKSFPKLVLNRSSNGDAFMLCLVINCLSSQMKMWIGYGRNEFLRQFEKGRWAWVVVFPQPSYLKSEFTLGISPWTGCGEEDEVEKGLAVRGEEQTLVEVLKTFLRRIMI